MNILAELRKLAASLEANLVDNGRDIDAVELRLKELTEERRTIIRGLEGIKAELKRLEGEE